MKERFIIFDETNGKSAKGDTLKWISRKYGIPYVSNSEELLKLMKEDAQDNLDENHSQQPDVKVNTHHNGEGEVAGEVYKPVGVRRGGITQYPSADTNDLCECGYNKWEHNQGLSYCSCKKFVKQNKEVSK